MIKNTSPIKADSLNRLKQRLHKLVNWVVNARVKCRMSVRRRITPAHHSNQGIAEGPVILILYL